MEMPNWAKAMLVLAAILFGIATSPSMIERAQRNLGEMKIVWRYGFPSLVPIPAYDYCSEEDGPPLEVIDETRVDVQP